MIHPTAIIDDSAQIGANVSVGPFTIIHGNVLIDDGATIGSHCEIGVPTPLADGQRLWIGAGSLIRSHSVFYEGSVFGAGLVTGHRVTVRELTRAGVNLQIGTLSDIQGHCSIGDYTRLHSNVHIGQKSVVGNFVWVFPYVVLTNDPQPPSKTLLGSTVHDFAVVATMAVVLPGVVIGQGALVGAHSLVTRDVDAETVVVGSPAKYLCSVSGITLKGHPDQPAYPWRRHFHRGYPDEVISVWKREFA